MNAGEQGPRTFRARGETDAAISPQWPCSLAEAPGRWWRTTAKSWDACGAFERLTLAYLAFLNLLILLFHRNLAAAPLFFAGHLALAAAVVALAVAARTSPHPTVFFLSHWYPMGLFLFFFEALHYLVHLVVPGWLDLWLIRFDYAFFGVHPTVWLEQFASPGLNDLMQFAYMTYYLFPVVLGGVLYRRRELGAFWAVFTGTAAAYYIGYAASILFPIEGPYHTLAALQQTELHGGVFTAAINWIESFGRVHGGAFPSAHVSGSFVVMLGAWRFRRRLFWIFLPFFLLMLVATVYGRYHYVADVFAGLLVGAVGFRAAGSPASEPCQGIAQVK
jgi:membrane-associated phospholipid phosphatase